jgi:type III secretion protein L
MTIERARILKGVFPVESQPRAPQAGLAQRIPKKLLDSRAEAERIVALANAQAAKILADARASAEAACAAAAEEARQQETARLAAAFLALRAADDTRASRDLDRTMDLAVLLAERLVGETLGLDPSRIAALAASALEEARGARKVRIEASPADVGALQAALGAIGHAATVDPDPSLGRGSLVVHTDLGRIDARLEPQLERLAKALKEALK